MFHTCSLINLKKSLEEGEEKGRKKTAYLLVCLKVPSDSKWAMVSCPVYPDVASGLLAGSIPHRRVPHSLINFLKIVSEGKKRKNLSLAHPDGWFGVGGLGPLSLLSLSWFPRK